MKIAQVSPLFESVPPKLYGGTERVVSYLTEELVRLGHEVTLFASGDSETCAELYAPVDKSLRLHPEVGDPLAYCTLMLEQLRVKAEEFDMIHAHIDFFPFPLFRSLRTPTVSTLHGRLDSPELLALYSEFVEIPVVSISDAQRRPLPEANFVDTIYHGLPLELYHYQESEGKYLAFIGRISPEKGLDDAIKTAKLCGVPLKIAAKVDSTNREYFEEVIRPLLDPPMIEYVGEISDSEKQEFLGNALALLFLIDWPEPFGLAMIESMACGTPVIARNRGSVPEVVSSGVTGLIVETAEEAADAVQAIAQLDRAQCRSEFERRFSVARMAQDYLRQYRGLQYLHNGLRLARVI